MDNNRQRLFLTLTMCLAATVLYMQLFMPAPRNPTTQPAATQLAADTTSNGETTSSPTASAGDTRGDVNATIGAADATGDRFSVVGGTDDSLLTIGDDVPESSNPYKLKLVLDPRGACVQTVTLSDHRESVKRKKSDPTPDAYKLLQPLKNESNGVVYRSFVVESLRLPDEDARIDLSDLTWTATREADDKGESVRFTAIVRDNGLDAFELARTFHIGVDSRQFQMSWNVRNLTEKPYRILLSGTGPIGVHQADSRFDSPRVMTAIIEKDGRVIAGEHKMKSQLIREEDRTHHFKSGEDHIYWYALSNKYFTCLVFPKPMDDKSSYAAFLDRVSAMPRFPDDEDHGDVTAEQVLAPPKPIAPGESVVMAMDVYCGDKGEKTFESMPVATARHYVLTTAPDRSACTFESIGVLMRWLLDKLHLVVRNYGVAIIILVIIVRLCLHPITRKGQINMMKMQKNQARIKPKLDALQKQFKNDKQKLGEETMKLYREEGINPASTLSGCIPMLLQTPIWIALYTTLNTGISLRHEPFFGYIRDLSAPDVLFSFEPFKIPFLWKMMGPIGSLNILPIIMAGVMLAQMKLSQKMAKDKKADEAAERAKTEGASPEAAADPVAQQQKMMTFMMPLFGLMFYNMPSGLCLYILSNSILGMVELYFIRKKLREDEASGRLAAEMEAKKKKSGRVSKWFEGLQEKAEQARLAQSQAQMAKPKSGTGKGKKKPRF
ncbi:MAG: YidC/Oxa1 family insertase periplasmic-domain containing protein [Phycisphaerales bacterium]|nr:YidC/Oxa1 family insertase periplasmic-domain containing protein [Phycisphaerales bacterium]